MIQQTSKKRPAVSPRLVKRILARAYEQSWAEAAAASDSPSRVDREGGVINGVKVVGLHSRCPARFIGVDSDEPYSYTDECLQAAIPLYEGAHVNVDHPMLKIDRNGERVPATESFNLQADKRFGQLRNVRYVPGDGLYADLHFLRSHPLAERVCEAAERMPTLFCLSHNVLLRPEFRDGRVAIVEILDVESVDLIGAKGGTNKGIYESGASEMESEHEPAGGMEAEGEGAPAAAPAAPAKLTVPEAFRVLLQAVLDDDTLPSAETIAKVEALMADLGVGGATGGQESGEGEGEGEGETATESGPKRMTPEGAMRALESAGVRITPARVWAYRDGTDAIRVELLAGWKRLDAPAAKPKGKGEAPASRPAMESAAAGAGNPAANAPREASLSMLRG